MNADKVNTNLLNGTCVYIGVNRHLSRSSVAFSGVSRTMNHQELDEVIGTGLICG